MNIKMALRKVNIVISILMLTHSSDVARASPVSDSLVNDKLDSKSLIKMGNILDKPILRLLGLTFKTVEQKLTSSVDAKLASIRDELVEGDKELEDKVASIRNKQTEEVKDMKNELCKLKSCTEWTEWSKCSAKQTTTFGVTTRSRNCGGSSGLCVSKSSEKLETDKRICEGNGFQCPSTYTLTTNNFCITIKNDTTKSWLDAQAECKEEGGNLINIDSELKAADVSKTLDDLSSSIYIYWIDGKRSLPNTEWQYEYGSDNTGLPSWYTAEPERADACLIFYRHRGTWYLYGVSCGGNRHFMCEII